MNNIRQTNYGSIRGVEKENYVVFRGIPYAKPPVGALRWRAPQKCDPWDGIYEAKEFSAKCPQNETPYGFFEKEFYSNPEFLRKQDEDCLYLNIWMPKGEKKDLPVAFYIHGGGFGGGYSSELEFDGEAYCKRDVILVTINYRVNVLGYLAHPWLSVENEKGISGNYGTQDQIAALTWFYENIEAFGGNPDNITVFGQSAGCMSTQNLISSELTGNMIAKAILQSGAVYKSKFLYTPTLEEEMEKGVELIELTGAKNIEEMRNLTLEQLAQARDKYGEISGKNGDGIVIVPNADGYILKEPVTVMFQKGEIKNIPYMIGTVADELGMSREDVAFGRKGGLYEDSRNWSLHLEEMGRKPAYVYYFSHPLPGDDNGAFHSAELWYMFGTLDRCWRPMTEEDYKISQEMLDYWTSFMKTGVPSGENEWRPHTKEDPYMKEF
jgi:para-nitrobenzyl esterase